MKLTTRLYIVVVVVTLFAIVASLFLVSTNRQVNTAFVNAAVIDQTVGGMVELSILTSDYLLSASDRASSQWQSKHDSIVRLLDSASFSGSEEQDLLQSALL